MPGPETSLELPELPEGWVYEGWAVVDGVPISTGGFSGPDAEPFINDDLGAGPAPVSERRLTSPRGNCLGDYLRDMTTMSAEYLHPYPSPETLADHPFEPVVFQRSNPAEMATRSADFLAEMDRLTGIVPVRFTSVQKDRRWQDHRWIHLQTLQPLQDAHMSDATTNANTSLHRWILIAVRVGLVIAIAISVSFPEWEQFAGKGMAFRAPFYLLPTIVVPIVWRMRGSHPAYPYLVDALVVAPFLLDTLGNVLNFYNNFDRTDDVLHFFNWVLLMGGATLGFARLDIGRLNAWTLSWGLGGLAIIWWEAAEFIVQELGTAGLGLTYEDTIGDLLLSSTGGGVGAAIAIAVAWPKGRSDASG